MKWPLSHSWVVSASPRYFDYSTLEGELKNTRKRKDQTNEKNSLEESLEEWKETDFHYFFHRVLTSYVIQSMVEADSPIVSWSSQYHLWNIQKLCQREQSEW